MSVRNNNIVFNYTKLSLNANYNMSNFVVKKFHEIVVLLRGLSRG